MSVELEHKIIDAIIAEYNVLRGEISIYHQQQKQAIILL